MNSSSQNLTIFPSTTARISISKSTFPIYPCVPTLSGSLSVLLLCLVSPFHTLILTVLIKQYEYPPRQLLLMSLSVYDNLQLSLTGLCVLVSFTFRLTTESLICQIIRQVIEFNAGFTTVGTSLTIVALSVERYISCFYCLRAHAILTSKRVKTAVLAVGILSFLCGCIVLHPHTSNPYPTALGRSVPLAFINVCTIFTCSIIVIVIQVRLFLISREKLKVDSRAVSFGRHAEASDLRRRQIKITFAAAIVAIVYVICMCPMGGLILYVFIVKGNKDIFKLRSIFAILTMVNTLADPFIYGFGMVDTRKLLFRKLKKIKRFLVGIFSKAD